MLWQQLLVNGVAECMSHLNLLQISVNIIAVQDVSTKPKKQKVNFFAESRELFSALVLKNLKLVRILLYNTF